MHSFCEYTHLLQLFTRNTQLLQCQPLIEGNPNAGEAALGAVPAGALPGSQLILKKSHF